MSVVSFPYMGTSYIAFSQLFRELGNEVIVPPRPTDATLSLGTKYSPEFACVPYKIVMGTYIEVLEKGANLLVTSGGNGPCRAGHYAQVHERTLRDMGYKFDMIVFEQPDKDLRQFLRDVKKLNAARLSVLGILKAIKRAWIKLKALDALEQLSHRVRPYEIQRNSTTRAYNEALALVDKAQTEEEILEAQEQGRRKLLSVPVDRTRDPLKVGIVGEIYVLLEPFANLELEETLGHLGVYCQRSIWLTGWTKDNSVGKAKDKTEAASVREWARPYLNELIGGHGQDSVGNTVLFARKGFDGVIQLAPFTCIPEIVAKSILPKVSRDKDIPVLSISCDEQTGKAGIQTRIEAFVDLLYRKREMKRAAGLLPDPGSKEKGSHHFELGPILPEV